MVDEFIMDAALQSHSEVARNRSMCNVCHTRCGQVHNFASSNTTQNGAAGSSVESRVGTPAGEGKTTGAGANTPNNVKDGNVYLDCVNCGRQVASNRYASHLSSCMGLGTGNRRGTTRSAAKSKQASDAGRSASPFPGSENGNMSDDSRQSVALSQTTAKSKGKPKGRPKGSGTADSPANRKRPASPQLSPPKKSKKQKTTGSAATRVKAEPNTPIINHHLAPPINSHSKVPSRLRESSTASFLEREPSHSSSPDSRSSSPGALLVSAATPSSGHSAQSPAARKRNAQATNGLSGLGSSLGGLAGSLGAGMGKAMPRVPSPPAPPIRRTDTEYLVDVEGDETGSSTDTDSD